ncbi:MAG: HNH endonuclease [Bacteroidetes bacterium]|nr:HNH endonuclease [Bacteroidota bacterium]
MKTSIERKKAIFQKTDGYCHICHSKLGFSNYGRQSTKGAWQIDHSKAKANGGSNHMNNLFAACISCNIQKGTKRTKTTRAQYGNTRAPFSKAKKQKIKNGNTAVGGVIGGLIGSVFGPVGAVVGAGVGAAIGNGSSPKK